MNKIIKINSDTMTVSARGLHKALEVKTSFKDWFPRMCEYGFAEGQDFSSFLSKSTGGRPAKDAQITVDMAKELCMIQRTDKGKEIRQYFIQVEKEWNSPESVMARALKMANQKLLSIQETNKRLQADNERMRPKEIFSDAVSASHTDILIGELAKILKGNGIEIGQNRLFTWLRENGYLIRRTSLFCKQVFENESTR